MNKLGTYIRIFLRDKVSLLLGIGSLTIGITVSIIIGSWYMHEKSYDNFHPESDNIYRICRKVFINNKSIVVGSDFNPLGKNIAKDFPEVTDALRMFPVQGQTKVKVEGKDIFADHFCMVSTNFFDFFKYKLKDGSVKSFQKKSNSIIIDEHLANKFFPNENPMGKIISYKGEREVVGVLENLPQNTHLTIHALVPIESVSDINDMTWGSRDLFVTYIKLANNIKSEVLPPKIKEYACENFEAYRQFKISYFLQPLKEIHLSSDFDFGEDLGVKTINPKLLNTFLLVACVILLIAVINFVNLFISSAFLRAKAIGLKKIHGAKRWQIILEFVGETFLYTLLATFIALTISVLTLPYFSQFIGFELVLDFSNPKFITMLAVICTLVSVIAGTIPGLYMSGFHSLETLKGRFRGKRIIALQKGLVISQFAASIALLISAMFINKQINFMNTANLGFSKDQLVYINIPKSYVDKIQSIQAELEKNTLIKGTCLSNGTTLQWWQGSPISKVETPENIVLAEIKKVQHSYFDVYGLEIIEGKNNLKDDIGGNYSTDCLINETAAKALNLEKPYIGKQIDIAYKKGLTITGIVKDAYTKSLNKKIDPQAYICFNNIWEGIPLMVKANGKDMKPVVELLRKQWEANETVYPFEYHFLDKEYEALYKTEQQAGILASWAMVIALFLTIAGLWGMARYSSDRRTKEIGIRKVNGATILEVIGMLNKEFLRWVIIAFVIAVPLSWYAVKTWLEGFMLRTNLSWWVFVLSGIMAVLVALVTVSWQSFKVANRNPVEALRYE